MATGSSIITYAKKFLGYGPSTFTSWYGVSSGTAWCDIFVSYVMAHNGVSFPKAAYVPTTQQWLARNATMVKMSQAQAGDVVIFTWSGGGNNTGTGSRDHIGFMIGRNSNGTFTTIEGNTSGNRVAIRTRYAVNIYGIYRPKYSGGSSNSNSSSSSGSSTSSTTANNGLYYVNTSDGLNVRTGPGTGYNRIDALPINTPVRVVRSTNGWGYSNGAKGWMSMAFLSKSKVSSSKSSTSSTTANNGLYYVSTSDGLNVRAGAGTKYKIIDTLPKGTPVKVVKTSNGFGYSNGARGWVCLTYLSRSKSSANSSNKTSSGYSCGMYHVNSRTGLNVRAGAGTKYRKVGLLRNNIPLKIVRISGSWGYSNGAHGWVHLGYCRKG